jgi:hypothetical protein
MFIVKIGIIFEREGAKKELCLSKIVFMVIS